MQLTLIKYVNNLSQSMRCSNNRLFKLSRVIIALGIPIIVIEIVRNFNCYRELCVH